MMRRAPWSAILLFALASACAVAWAITLLWYDGRASVNAYGEGWPEVAVFVALALVGARELHRAARPPTYPKRDEPK